MSKKALKLLTREKALLRDFIDELTGANDRACALVAAAAIDAALKTLVSLKLPALNDELEEALFYQIGGPLASLSNRTIMARALGIVSNELASNIDRIRAIRNAFSHSARSISFDIKEISSICKSLTFEEPEPKDLGKLENRSLFTLCAIQCYTIIVETEVALLNAQGFLAKGRLLAAYRAGLVSADMLKEFGIPVP